MISIGSPLANEPNLLLWLPDSRDCRLQLLGLKGLVLDIARAEFHVAKAPRTNRMPWRMMNCKWEAAYFRKWRYLLVWAQQPRRRNGSSGEGTSRCCSSIRLQRAWWSWMWRASCMGRNLGRRWMDLLGLAGAFQLLFGLVLWFYPL